MSLEAFVRSKGWGTGVSVTLSLYLARQFTAAVMAMILALTGLVSLFDCIDLLRRVASKPHVPSSMALKIACLHIPYFAITILPFGVLLGGIVCFWRLTRSSELIVARAAGISAWQFLAAPLACALLIGTTATTLVTPLSSMMYRRAELLDDTYLRTGGGPLALNGGSLWVRQPDRQNGADGVAILYARVVHMRGGTIHLQEVSVFRLGDHDRLVLRIEAPRGELDPGHWTLEDASSIRPDHLPVPAGTYELPTNLTVPRVEESFASPETMSVWALPGFIRLLERSGFTSIRHRLHFQTLLALPILAGTMALVAAGFSMRPSRRGGVARMIGSGVAAGFVLFTVSKVAAQFGESGALPPVLAAWAPTGAGLCLAIALLLHLEDG
ncbi:LPS export ABC transporter permease LptG [Acidomonas methanolica]|uniref:Transporter YjgP/YjgQ n=1 Tax=Acidomonas methanolica NBRC 104435 TaxID=1231351 RepID=A0A023D666_ACIMT|nr:LPS export ABC transporter permease LptG [Acidomonas methanolica]MBU2654344.1 LPS export ABC transporter permease LptG [Acidomonas methanolica]TCS28432.1 lipopolysaccharide export system permease protein [Acidomonas methanolica]GAJ29215.1 transporter YjgP/YjgQ [Acidomonas methanolica NBRC 104435]GBQ58794.1 transporter YjgP/YjgQ [Acidomonas methanolica]GEK99571.1 LPS export ABC transporter permease LptG [Acidomonas methanolica NBRC 104435]